MVERILARGGVLGSEEQMVSHAPMGRMVAAEGIAHAVVWLCSDPASLLIGETLSVDGGHCAL
jgi:NAD(P)-dependent dehydrogenase (short-subunit alcohol dehydrogenase family)